MLSCIKQTLPELDPPVRDATAQAIPSRSERKTMLKAARAFKKARYLDDPAIAAALLLIDRRDTWLIQRGKSTAGTKLYMK